MADKKISQLTSVTSVLVTDVLPIVQNSVTKKVTVESLFESIPSDIKYAGISVETGTPDQVQSAAASLSTAITYLTNITTGTTTVTLADGIQGQEKTFVCTVHETNDVELIPASFIATKITFTAVGQTAKLKYMNGSWHIMSVYGATVV